MDRSTDRPKRACGRAFGAARGPISSSLPLRNCPATRQFASLASPQGSRIDPSDLQIPVIRQRLTRPSLPRLIFGGPLSPTMAHVAISAQVLNEDDRVVDGTDITFNSMT